MGKKFLFFLMCVTAIGLGVVHGKNSFEADKIKKNNTGTGTGKPTAIATTAPKVRPTKIPRSYNSAMKKALKFYRDGNFTDSEVEYRRAARILKMKRMTENSGYAKARRAQYKAYVFALIAEYVPRNPLVSSMKLIQVTVKNSPDPIIAEHIGEDDSTISLLTKIGTTEKIKKTNIAARKSITARDYKNILIKKLDKLEKNSSSAVDFYDSAYFALQNRLDKRSRFLLEKMLDQPDWEVIIDVFLADEDRDDLKKKINIAYGRRHVTVVLRPTPTGTGTGRGPDPVNTAASWTPPVATGTTSAPPIATGTSEPWPIPTATAEPPPPAVSSELAAARNAYKQGLQYFNKAIPSRPDYKKNILLAAPLLEKARDLYQALYDRTNKSHYERRLVDIQQALYFVTRELTPQDLDELERRSKLNK